MRELLADLGDRIACEIVGEAQNGFEALERLPGSGAEVLLLDIQMPGMDGLELARHLCSIRGAPAVVFVTAHDRHAVEAFELNALDYLLKPVDHARLEQAVQRAQRRHGSDQLLKEQLDRIVRLVQERQGRQSQIAVKVGDRFLLVQADDIIFASLADDSINIVTGQVSGTSNYRTLDDLQARLDPEVFWRVHRSHLGNINKIKEIVPWFSRNYILRMKDAKATEIPVSRMQTKRLREYLKL